MKPKATSSGAKSRGEGSRPISTASTPEPSRLRSSVRRRPSRSVSTPPARIETNEPAPKAKISKAASRGAIRKSRSSTSVR